MGKRGPIPKNEALKVLSGTLPVTKETAEALATKCEPPKPPKHFKKDERQIWRMTVALLLPSRILEKTDQAILGAYCDSYVKWQKAERELERIEKEQGVNAMLVSVGANFTKVANPLLAISRKAQADMVSYAAQLGMTPAARIRAQIVPAKEKSNPFEKIKGPAHASGLDANRKRLREVIDAESEQE